MNRRAVRLIIRAAFVAAACGTVITSTPSVRAQVAITEVMYDTDANETIWEWIEVRNTTAAPVDLNGWIFDDDDDNSLQSANITSGSGNTIVPAGGIAVLYNASPNALDFNPTRFTNTWGSPITLVGVNGFTGLSNSGDALALWDSLADYQADDLMVTSGIRRTFNSAVTSLDYTTGYPNATNGRSLAWKGTGSVTDPMEWVASIDGEFGARTSVPTTMQGLLNSTDDVGTPGMPPAGTAAPGLRITEIMYNPASPDEAWEWVEIYNNTGTLIDFSATNYVIDDDDDAHLSAANISSGSIAQGATAVLFNAVDNTLFEMQAAWGATVNFIPVTQWTEFANGGDLVAIWPSLAAYTAAANLGTENPRRSTAGTSAFVQYFNEDDGWPNDDGDSAIEVTSLDADLSQGASWLLSNGRSPMQVIATLTDHTGGDIGSPGAVGTELAGVLGDYNNDGSVDAADYVLWRNGGPLANESDMPGTVNEADYTFWRSRFGATSGSGATLDAASVPEPTSTAVVLSGIALYFATSLGSGELCRVATCERRNGCHC
jgi:hypothetical protein